MLVLAEALNVQPEVLRFGEAILTFAKAYGG